jgi:3-oxocholest-4-en-26-oyl-CoA dehydrogenase alpha subunit
MLIALTAEQEQFLGELRSYLDGLEPELLDPARAEYLEDPMAIRERGRALLKRLGRDGWLGISWPVQYGGQGRSATEQWLFQEEMYLRKLPAGLLTLSSIGPTLIRAGSDAQRAEFLPRMLAGEIDVAIGYTEPDAGTDLASLRTRAVRDGGEYVVDGQKVYTTGAQVATHLWLAARTGSPDSRHRGLSVFLLPIGSEGITVRPLITQGDERTNEVFLDGVRASAEALIGAENGGWNVITTQLNFERLFCHNEARYELSLFAHWAAGEGRLAGDQPAAVDLQLALGELAADVEIARLFAMRSAAIIDSGHVPVVEASINKVWYSELRQRICAAALEQIGEAGQLGYGQPEAPAGGAIERAYRASTVLKFGAGTNEVQRNIIAQVGLGMPR